MACASKIIRTLFRSCHQCSFPPSRNQCSAALLSERRCARFLYNCNFRCQSQSDGRWNKVRMVSILIYKRQIYSDRMILSYLTVIDKLENCAWWCCRAEHCRLDFQLGVCCLVARRLYLTQQFSCRRCSRIKSCVEGESIDR